MANVKSFNVNTINSSIAPYASNTFLSTIEGLTASNVQDGIEELNDNIADSIPYVLSETTKYREIWLTKDNKIIDAVEKNSIQDIELSEYTDTVDASISNIESTLNSLVENESIMSELSETTKYQIVFLSKDNKILAAVEKPTYESVNTSYSNSSTYISRIIPSLSQIMTDFVTKDVSFVMIDTCEITNSVYIDGYFDTNGILCYGHNL